MPNASKTSSSSPSALGGAMIIAGTAIGAGMLALPIVTAGMWYLWGIVIILLVWLAMYTSGLFILEANLHYPEGAHLGTIAKDVLPLPLRILNDLSLVFVLYILTYAYITIGSPFLSELFMALINSGATTEVAAPTTIVPMVEKIMYVVLFGGVVMISTFVVDRATTLIVIAMVITFFLSLPSLFGNITLPSLLNTNQESPHYLPYILGGTAAFVASFGYHGNVSSLVKYYKKDYKKVKAALFWGTFIVALTYIIWITSTHGAIDRETFKGVILTQKDPVDALINRIASPTLTWFKNLTILPSFLNAFIEHIASLSPLTWFKNLAILSSFLGVTLGLFDYIADQLKLSNTLKGRFITALITYAPPTLVAIIYPYGFIHAIGYAGFFATFWALTIPAIMVYKTREKFPQAPFTVFGGRAMIGFIILFGTIVAISELLALFNILPKY